MVDFHRRMYTWLNALNHIFRLVRFCRPKYGGCEPRRGSVLKPVQAMRDHFRGAHTLALTQDASDAFLRGNAEHRQR
jgi:hypothetical protein